MSLKKFLIECLKKKAHKLRKDTFIEFIKKGEAHLGGSFSMIETLVYFMKLFLKKKTNLF